MKFNLPAYTTNYFSTQVFVVCPKCSQKAMLTSTPSKNILPINNDAILQCTHCNFNEESGTDWKGFYQGFVNQACRVCGTKVCASTKPTKAPYKEEKVVCTACKKEKKYKLLWAPYRSNTATDPYFGYNLWFQTNVKNNLLWGYNTAHLEYIKTYVKATLREDNNRHIYSLIANLPQWMLLAKNRETIVKKIDKLILINS